MSPRIYCYFNDVYHPNLFICNFNGKLLAIKEFNDENDNIKIANSLDNLCNFKFPFSLNKIKILILLCIPLFLLKN